ncbi:protein kinase domain-containing protein [Archangium sp.]|uniref:protein kinase domain-containing protein n=1 Tax=Archangium sp. TaxID=1872627 RepID=UPI00286CE731|nr:protein kinase [Archangium sp.]
MADSAGPRLRFDFEGFRYEVYGTQVDHRDYDTLLLAWRQAASGGPRSQVILKPVLLPSDYERSSRAREEMQIASYLQHPGIAKTYGLTAHADLPYVVTEHMRGCYLLTAMDFALLVGRGLSSGFAAYVAAEVADALAYAHAFSSNMGEPLHIIHRAVSPMRIRLGFDGRVKLTNFGAAYGEIRNRLQTPPGLLRGDPAYCAPELLRDAMEATGRRSDRLNAGGIDGRADVFSLGLVLLEMLLAEYPLDPSDVPPQGAPKGFAYPLRAERSTQLSLDVLAYRLLRFRPEDAERQLELAPEPLRPIVRRALQPDPAERISAATLRDELRAYLHGLDRSFGAGELAAELQLVFEAAAKIHRLTANPIERTALSPDEQGD